MTWPRTIHHILRPPRGNRRLKYEVDDSEFATPAPAELSVDVVTAHASMVNVEAAVEKNVFRSKVHSCQHLAVMLFDLFYLSVKRIFLMIVSCILVDFLVYRGTVIVDHFTAQDNMAVLGTIWFGVFVLLMLMMWYLF
ncbi:hypothetical protein BELL_0052g00230 [Botrytis elliptica]|uniref:Uncharacterized protein n=1 Tax=Botrytis elliptica TaxID=278938 RepID=A0A4Z1JZA6_9HELO|nr:hypothetical protein BELL_0052g00230 [Botrytis elliptica]